MFAENKEETCRNKSKKTSFKAHRGPHLVELSSSRALGILAFDDSLREDPCHAAAAVVGMRNAYRYFQAEVVGQNKLG